MFQIPPENHKMECRNLISFVKAKPVTSIIEEPQEQPPTTVDGDEIKLFYDNLVNTHFEEASTSNLSGCENSLTPSKKTEERRQIKEDKEEEEIYPQIKEEKGEEKFHHQDVNLQKLHKDLLVHAQSGDIKALEKLLQNQYVDVNFQDQFGWTAMMCSAVAGHYKVVRYLMSKGASRFDVNKSGKSVDDLVPSLEIKLRKLDAEVNRQKSSVSHQFETFYCDICAKEFKETTKLAHQSSTVHLFNMGVKPKNDNFNAHVANKGFQLMQKSGWDGESGLGSQGQGQKFPVKTSLKRDRKCLGADDSKLKAKVTHFGPNDLNAVNSLKKKEERVVSARTVSRRQRNRQIQKDKKWERELRTYMNIDF